MSELKKSKCSLGLTTRAGDLRNFNANLSHNYDLKYNIPYTEDDEKEKLRIFNIPNSKTDFTNGNKLKGIGDHLYPLVKEFKAHKRLGSDSMWNRIPVSGYNRKYHENMENKIKIDLWKKYCKMRGAHLYHDLSDERYNEILEFQQNMIDHTRRLFNK